MKKFVEAQLPHSRTNQLQGLLEACWKIFQQLANPGLWKGSCKPTSNIQNVSKLHCLLLFSKNQENISISMQFLGQRTAYNKTIESRDSKSRSFHFQTMRSATFPLNIASNIPLKVMIETLPNEVVKKRQMQQKYKG